MAFTVHRMYDFLLLAVLEAKEGKALLFMLFYALDVEVCVC